MGATSTRLCPLCAAKAEFAKRVGDSFYAVTAHQADLYHCSDCGSFFQMPIPERAVIAAFYPQGYWQESAATSVLARLQNLYVSLMLKLDPMSWVRKLRLSRGARFLDVGCSRGDWLALIACAGYRAEGLEADPRAAAFARKFHGVAVTEADGDTWAPEPASFDAISAFHLLEHLREPAAFLDKVHHALKDGGRLLLRVPNVSSWQVALLGWRWKGWEMPRHITMFTPGALAHLLEARGFVLETRSTWSLRDGPPCFASSLFPQGEPTWQQIKQKPSALRTLLYLGLTWMLTPLELLAAALGKGSMITLIARKR